MRPSQRWSRLAAAALVAGLVACGLSDPEVPRVFYLDPPNEPITGDPFRVLAAHQYVARLMPTGPAADALLHYTGRPVAWHVTAWDPVEAVMYSYGVNERPSETWLIAVSVPGLERTALSRIPDAPRRRTFSPLFAFDARNRRLVVADGQRPCGGRFAKVWHVYDVARNTWSEGTLERHSLTTLDYDQASGGFVGVGIARLEEGTSRVVARFDGEGRLLEQVESDICDVLEPRIHGYDRQIFQSQLVGGTISVYRHVYYGSHAEDGVYWERQRYDVDVHTGAARRVAWGSPAGVVE